MKFLESKVVLRCDWFDSGKRLGLVERDIFRNHVRNLDICHVINKNHANYNYLLKTYTYLIIEQVHNFKILKDKSVIDVNCQGCVFYSET